MQAIAAFILRGRNPAIISTVSFAILGLMVAPLELLSAASVGLVTLVQGRRDGLFIVIVSSILMAIMAAASGQLLFVFEFVLKYWLPIWIMAQVLKNKQSLPLAMTLATGFGLLAVLVVSLVLKDPAAEWLVFLNKNVLPVLQKAGIELDMARVNVTFAHLADWLTGLVSALWVLSLCLSLLIARWWQASLYRPGAFGEEFRTLRFGVVLAFLGLAILLAEIVVMEFEIKNLLSHIVLGFTSVAVVMFLFQGLAVLHAFIEAKKLTIGWLVMLYITLFLMMPYIMIVIALAGLADNWLNFRARIQKPVG